MSKVYILTKPENIVHHLKTVCLLFLLCCLCSIPLSAQHPRPFEGGEKLNYEINYKYGFMMVKAGIARYEVKNADYNNVQSIKTSLNFKTTSFFDKVFKVRDTLDSYLDKDFHPLYHKRSINEGSTQFFEEIYFKKHSKSLTEVRVKRQKGAEVKFDTIMKVDNLGYDILNIFVFARTLDYANLNMGDSFLLTSFVGKKKIKINVRYMGQSIFEKSEELKYKALRLEVDIVDDVFNTEQTAMEIWISDDENRVPLKLKAKLKIGAAEAVLSSYSNLKYPLKSEIRIKPN